MGEGGGRKGRDGEEDGKVDVMMMRQCSWLGACEAWNPRDGLGLIWLRSDADADRVSVKERVQVLPETRRQRCDFSNASESRPIDCLEAAWSTIRATANQHVLSVAGKALCLSLLLPSASRNLRTTIPSATSTSQESLAEGYSVSWAASVKLVSSVASKQDHESLTQGVTGERDRHCPRCHPPNQLRVHPEPPLNDLSTITLRLSLLIQ